MTIEERRIERACEDGVVCYACRMSAEQRHAMRMPELCPNKWPIDQPPPERVHIPAGQMAICKQCDDFPNSCSSISLCKSCGGREVPRLISPCEKT